MNSATVSNVTFALPSPGMEIVMDSPRSGRAVALSELLRQTFIVIRDLDSHAIRSRELSMTHVSKAMASHLLLGNLATSGVTNSHYKANAVDPSAFLPQRNLRSSRSNGPKTSTVATSWGWTCKTCTKQRSALGLNALAP